jgi:predicted nucleic acid-binding Zn ribbon protein
VQGTATETPPTAPPEPPADKPAAPANACPRCGAPIDPDQLACVECGSSLRVRWRRPPSWRLPAGIAAGFLLLAGLAFGFGIGKVADGPDGDLPATVASGPPPAPPAQPQPSAPPEQPGAKPDDRKRGEPGAAQKGSGSAPKAGGAAAPSGGAREGSSGGTSSPERDRSGGSGSPQRDSARNRDRTERRKLATWPPGQVGYSVILLSTTDREEAVQAARDAVHADIGAGYAQSDRFTTLEPGRWIVFAGRFDTLKQAEQAAARYRRKGFDGEARLLESKVESSDAEPEPPAPPPAG